MAYDLAAIAQKTKYPPEAFLFVQGGLDYTVCQLHGKAANQGLGENRHVGGQQLCLGLRDFAIKQYGLLAKTVLKRWNIACCEDFGHIVFAMVDTGLMHKTEQDSIDDFKGVYDFSEAFNPSLTIQENGK